MLLLSVTVFFFFSCDFIMKDRKDDDTEANTSKVVLGTDKDENGCVTSAGYKWSLLRRECVRPFEEGYRLNAIEQLEGESIDKSAFVIFEDGGERAELYLPDAKNSVMLEEDDKKGNYSGSGWKLHQKDGYKLQKGSQILYAGAKIEEGQITGYDKPEDATP